ncbi:MAG: hypothetical protein E7673_02200 [Ruminococcaceae bacterium]|nr:hypothetical protein [Oscillospiraceae bacterium]
MFDVKGIESGEYIEYKGRPLVRKDDDLYYGDLAQCYVKMMIMTEKSSVKPDEKIPDNIAVQLFLPGKPFPEKQIFAKGLSDAFETAAAWLDRYNK